MKNRGFTLTEILVTLVIIGIISAFTIPNITGILKNNRDDSFYDDAYRLYEVAKVKESVSKTIKPTVVGNCSVYTLNYLDSNNGFDKSPNCGVYDGYDSYVIVKYDSLSDNVKNYKYYIRLVENVSGKTYGINLAELEKVEKKDKMILGSVTRDLQLSNYEGLCSESFVYTN